MKITAFLLSVLFLSGYTSFLFCAALKEPEAVRDTNGKKLRTDAYYYIAPDDNGNGGGLSLDSIGGEYSNYCPVGVIQEPYDYQDGRPVKFYNANLKKNVIRISTDLNIEFLAQNICGGSNVWKLQEFDPSMGKYFVGVDGVVGNPSIETRRNWFKIEKFANYYKLVYCPTVLRYKGSLCKDVGIVYQNGKRRLALTDSDPLIVKFVKISE